MHDAALWSMLCAALVAGLLAWRHPPHKRAAFALAALYLACLARARIYVALPEPGQPIPRELWPLVYLDTAAELATFATVAGLSVSVFLPPRWRRAGVSGVVGAWALASIILAALYPAQAVRDGALQGLYLGADLIGLFVGWVPFIQWARWAKGRRSANSAQGVAIGLWILDLGILVAPLSPWRGSVFFGRFQPVQVEILVFFAAISAAQGVVLWTLRRS
jgi:hypothetical protein